MGLLGLCPLLLMAPALLLGGPSGSSQHSLLFLYISTWEPDQDLFYFAAMGYVDDQLAGHYDSITKKAVPRVPWVRMAENENPLFWDWNTNTALNDGRRMKINLMNIQKLYKQTGGTHTLQRLYGCELSKEGHLRGFDRYAYNGEDYISFDKETLTWRAAVEAAQVTKREWDADVTHTQILKGLLEEGCLWWLQTGLVYAKESLLRREPPVVKVARKASYKGLETLTCRAHGFHPREIDATWRKDGEVWEQETFRGGVVPNSDGTYHIWLSIKIDPKDRDHFRCHVEHDSLLEPLNVAWEEHTSSKAGLIVGALVGVVAAVLTVVGIIFCIRRRQGSHQAGSS